MNYEDFKEVIHGRRSVRKFTEQEVSTSDIKEIIDCACYAPSDTNSQTWEFLVIMNREKLKKLNKWHGMHYINLRQKLQKTEKRKQGNYLHVLSTICNSFLGGTSINRMFGNAIWIKVSWKDIWSNCFCSKFSLGRRRN